MKKLLILLLIAIVFSGCVNESATKQEQKKVEMQKRQYSIGQPIPAFNWSFERHQQIELYKIRNKQVATHSVWRSDYGMIEGDCPSLGYGMPYDVSLTNPLTAIDFGRSSFDRHVVEQEEPNGIFASKNTSATWVMCVGDAGSMEPHYVESKVTVYPGPVKVNYDKNRVTRHGKTSVSIKRK